MNTQPPAPQPQPPAYAGPPMPPGAPLTPTEQPAPKRNWFGRHKILTGVLFAVGLITLGTIASGGDSDDSTPPPAASDGEQAADDAEAGGATGAAGAADAEPGEEDAAEAEEPAAEEAPDQPGIGDLVTDGDFEFVVTEVELGLDRVGSDFLSTESQGQFVLVHATITNIGDSESTFYGSDQSLVDTQDRTHSADTEAAIYLEDANSFITDVNPGNSTDVIVIFDIPADAVPATVELHGSMFSRGVSVTVAQG